LHPAQAPLDDLHSLCLRSLRWSRVETPLPRFGHAAAALRNGTELIFFGGLRAGATGATFYSDTWRLVHPASLDGALSIERVRRVGEPPRRFAHCMAALKSTVYVFGGSDAAAEMADLYAGEME
jgi:hypothetical protein